MEIKDQILRALANPVQQDEPYDLHAELRSLLSNVHLDPADAGGEIFFSGRDPVVPSVFRLAGAAAIVLAVYIPPQAPAPGHE